MPVRIAVLGDVHFTDARLRQNALQGGDWPRADLGATPGETLGPLAISFA